MKQVYLCALLLCFVAGTFSQTVCPLVNQVARYRLTFTGEFTAASALRSYGPNVNGTSAVGAGNTSAAIPNSAYPFDNNSIACNQSFFGHLIGTTHNYTDTNYLWENAGRVPSSFATYVSGSYTGSRLRNYINNHIETGKFNDLIYIPQTLPFNGTESVEFELNYTSPLVDVVVSIVPSPDWFVGVSKLPLFEQGHWYRYIAIDLYAWDAGVRDGQDFESTATSTVPQYRVSSLRNRYPFVDFQNPLGVMIFERLDSETCVQSGATYYSDVLTELVNFTVSDSSCSKPIPYQSSTPYGVPPTSCYNPATRT